MPARLALIALLLASALLLSPALASARPGPDAAPQARALHHHATIIPGRYVCTLTLHAGRGPLWQIWVSQDCAFQPSPPSKEASRATAPERSSGSGARVLG